MIALLSRFIPGGGGLGLYALAAIGFASLLLANGIENRRLAQSIAAQVAEARAQAITGRDAHWQGEIARSNVAAEAERRRRAEDAIAVDAAARAEIARLEKSLADMEAKNAALPGGAACGLDRERVRILSR